MPLPTITYRTAGPWGAGTGADLDADVIDNNFYSIAQSIEDLINNPATPNNIASIDVVNNNQLVITLDDYTTFGPFDMPIATFADRGEWAPVTAYVYGDIFTYTGSLYMVLQDHTSSASFSATATNMVGPLYRTLFDASDLMLEWVGEWAPLTAYGTFKLFSVPDVGVYFTLVAHTSAATFDPLATDESGNDLYQKVFEAIESEVARVQAQFPGSQPSDESAMMVYIQDDDRDLVFAEDFPESFAHLEVAVTVALSYSITYNGAEIGTIEFAPGDLLDGDGGQFGTITGDGGTISNGELLRLIAPDTADTTASFLTVALKGTYEAVAS